MYNSINRLSNQWSSTTRKTSTPTCTRRWFRHANNINTISIEFNSFASNITVESTWRTIRIRTESISSTWPT